MRPNLRVGGERRGLLPAVYPLPLLVLVSSCVSYQPAPLDSAQILAGLNELRWVPPAATGAEAAPDGSAPTREQLASFAILHNPSLRALRAEIGVADSLLVQAGLLPDPTIGWDAMDVVAAEVNGSGATSQEYLSGLGVEFPLLRPGERDARKAVASLHAEEARLLVTLGEWALAREVFLAYERVVSSRLLLEQNAELAGIAQNTHEYFERARESGASTAIEANLALGDLQAIRLDAIGLESQLSRDEQHLRALLGLPPGSEVELRTAGGEPEAAQLLAAADPVATCAHAAKRRAEQAGAARGGRGRGERGPRHGRAPRDAAPRTARGAARALLRRHRRPSPRAPASCAAAEAPWSPRCAGRPSAAAGASTGLAR